MNSVDSFDLSPCKLRSPMAPISNIDWRPCNDGPSTIKSSHEKAVEKKKKIILRNASKVKRERKKSKRSHTSDHLHLRRRERNCDAQYLEQNNFKTCLMDTISTFEFCFSHILIRVWKERKLVQAENKKLACEIWLFLPPLLFPRRQIKETKNVKSKGAKMKRKRLH